jgi:hypothetical protein
MPKVVVTCRVKDPVKWEASFRTHGSLFRTYNLRAPVQFSITGNEVAICTEPADLGAYKKAMDSPETAQAMTFDGVERETVKIFVLDKELKV